MKSPFKFLDSYTKDDREIFFGRDREIEELYHRVFESKIMLVYGVSGTGKSSLIHCGLANKFQDIDWLPIVIRRGGNIIESMAAGIRSASITEQQSRLVTPADFKKGVRSLYLDHYKPVFLIFDQFEELFIFGDKEERRSFIQIVKSLVDSELQCRFIFVMREEYMAWVTEFEKIISTFFSNRVRIEKMSHSNALEAIKGPCNAFNISLEEGFAESLLEKLSPGETDVELTYLQVFLDKIYRLAAGFLPPPGGELKGGSSYDLESKGGPSFTLELLNKTGNVSDLLGSFLEEQLSLLDNPETAMAVLKSFVSIKGTKQPMRPEEVREYSLTLGKNINEQVLVELIQTFVNLRVLRDKNQNGCYELRHDALATKIFEKFTLTEKELLEVRRFVENSYYAFEKRGILLNKQDLDYLSGYEKNITLPEKLNDFVILCKNKYLSQKKYLTRITRIFGLIFILIVAAVMRYYFINQEKTNATKLIGTALFQSERQQGKGLLTALNLWQKDSISSVLQYIVLNDFQRLITKKADSLNPVFKLQQNFAPFGLESAVIKAEISKEGNYIYGWLQNNRVFIWNTGTCRIFYFESNGELQNMKLSEKDSLTALIYSNNKGIVCDFHGKTIYNFETTFNNIMNERLFSFFPDGSSKLAVVKDSSVLVYDSKGEVIANLKGHSANVNAVDISPNGRFVATASCDEKVIIWSCDESSNQISRFNTLKGHSDTVWSCEFNKTGKYIITASADSTIRIWNLYGEQINPIFHFAGFRFRYNNKEVDEDASNPIYSAYYGKDCNASFSSSEKEIIVTEYVYSSDTVQYIKPVCEQALFYDKGSACSINNIYSFLDFAGEKYKPVYHNGFQRIVVSPAGNPIACVTDIQDKIFIFLGEGLRILTLNGNFPMYSKNGCQIFWINKDGINKMPLTQFAVRSILNKYRILESLPPVEEPYVSF
jgi:WD40 repeat protein